MPFKIAKVVVGLPIEGPFDYLIGDDFMCNVSIGQRVLVSFNRRKRIGYIVSLSEKSVFKKLNPILALLDKSPILDEKALKLCKEFSEQYGCSYGEAIEAYLPPFLRKKKNYDLPVVNLPLEPIKGKDKNTLLIDKSGTLRWQYLFKEISEAVANQRNVIFLVPEVAFIEKIKKRLEKNISCEVFAVKKTFSSPKEMDLWTRIRTNQAKIIIGTRSVVFSPCDFLGMIVIYDEENSSYKQEQTPPYHSSTIAEMRSKMEGCRLIYVSSAPLAETWQKFKEKKEEIITFEADKRIDVKSVDMTNYNPKKTSVLSFPLQICIEKVLKNNGKVILFMNRKGLFTMTRCNECGHVLKCRRCNVNLVYMYSKKIMSCPQCNYREELSEFCPSCKRGYLTSVGFGVEKIESKCAKMFPFTKVACFDKESKSISPKVNLVIATQAILKMKECFAADLVAIINFDAELNRFDFRSAHKAFNLLSQLKSLATETLLIQTSIFDNYCIRTFLKNDYNNFYQQELDLREEIGLPPFKELVYVTLRGANNDLVLKKGKDLFRNLVNLKDILIGDKKLEKQRDEDFLKDLRNFPAEDLEISDIHPAANPKLRDNYRYSIMIKGKCLKGMLTFIKRVIKQTKAKKDIITTIVVDQ